MKIKLLRIGKRRGEDYRTRKRVDNEEFESGGSGIRRVEVRKKS